MGYRIGIDVGGTFTDVVLVDETTGAATIGKALNRHADRAETLTGALIDLLANAGVAADDVVRISHGTTITTNAVIERRGARTALITNAGFRDILEIGRFARPEPFIYRLDAERPEAIVPRRLRFGVPGRIDRTGAERVPLDMAALERVIDDIEAAGVEAVAVALLFSFLNPAHERAVGARLKARLPEADILLSSDVMPEFREFPRTSTTVFAAYVATVLRRYLTRLTERLAAAEITAPLYMFQSNGGAATPEVVLRNPAYTLLSGPAGAVAGAAKICGEAGYRDLITMDIGGTSLDVCVVRDGTAETTTQRGIDFFPVGLSVIDIHTVGAGGGSIVKVDEVGRVKVGPHSMGADPGPAAYGRGGTEATITDVNLVLGLVDPADFAGGTVPLDVAKAEEAIRRNVAEPLGISVEAAAVGVFRVATNQMAEALRTVTVERGFDPRDFALVAFGGGGPIHAAAVARELGIARVLVPVNPGVFSAHGIARSDIRHAYTRSLMTLLGEMDAAAIAAVRDALEGDAAADFAVEEVAEADRVLTFALDMRYRGQSTEITVPAPAEVVAAGAGRIAGLFHAAHERLFGYHVPGEPIEVAAARLDAVGRIASPPVRADAPELGGSRVMRRVVDTETGAAGEVPVYRRAAFAPGDAFDGPAIVTEASSTTVVPAGARAEIDHAGNLVLTVTP
ncbi:hydantoinase/oxoprolinase family protein [Acuticoccus sediminis]|uniref:hydantoinase/oxoprolinase family protein n=1 Tax=Acuticoccus sediminis TaxID=2184697 RepID=UPI001CFD065F|nr:hydantoinase/oxoprolinase family protein [Acuticoccus sediminis]